MNSLSVLRFLAGRGIVSHVLRRSGSAVQTGRAGDIVWDVGGRDIGWGGSVFVYNRQVCAFTVQTVPKSMA